MSDGTSATETVQARLEALRAKRAEVAAARRALEASRAVEQELLDETRALADEQAIHAAEIEHGPIGRRFMAVKTDAGMILVKRPHMNTFRKYQDNGVTDSAALEKLVRPCVIYPDLARYEEILSEVPAALMKCANAVTYLAGVRKEDLTAK